MFIYMVNDKGNLYNHMLCDFFQVVEVLFNASFGERIVFFVSFVSPNSHEPQGVTLLYKWDFFKEIGAHYKCLIFFPSFVL